MGGLGNLQRSALRSFPGSFVRTNSRTAPRTDIPINPPARVMRSVRGRGTEALPTSKGRERLVTLFHGTSWRCTTLHISVCEQWQSLSLL